MEFFEALRDNPLIRNAVLAGLLASVACGIMGTYVVARRITYVAGGISHAVLGGIGAALYVQKVHRWPGLDPLYGAVAAAMAAALVIGYVNIRARQREDTVIGAVWAIGVATGVLFISRTPEFSQDIMSYLFGNILMVSARDLWLMALLDALVVGAGLLLYNQFQAVCFDEEFADVRGLRVKAYYLLLLCIVALTVVLLVTVVGIVMVIALLTLPAAVAGQFSKTLARMMGLAVAFSAVFTFAGLAISYQPDLPSGATIVVLAGATYLAVTAALSMLRRHRG